MLAIAPQPILKFGIYQSDSDRSMDLKLEWDKNERRKARNRINQRNYRKRRSEQQLKEDGQERVNSSSMSPNTLHSLLPDRSRDGSTSSQGESSMPAFRYGLMDSSWHTSITNEEGSLEPMMRGSEMLDPNDRSTTIWNSTEASSSGSASRNVELQAEASNQHNFSSLGEHLNLQSLTSRQSHDIWSGSPNLVHRPSMLNRSLSTASTTSVGKTTLHLAAENNIPQTIRMLLLHGADPNIRASDGSTPLHLAAERGYSEAVMILIESGCDLNFRTSSGRTALHLATENDHTDVIEQLLRAGADPNLQILG